MQQKIAKRMDVPQEQYTEHELEQMDQIIETHCVECERDIKQSERYYLINAPEGERTICVMCRLRHYRDHKVVE